MTQKYFSPATGGFYHEAIHGARMIDGPLTTREAKAGKRPEQVPNPACTIPEDAVPISEARFAELMAAQADGMTIVAKGAAPVARKRVLDEAARQAARRTRRDNLLAKSDWTQLPDANPPGGVKAWSWYRQQLRDLDMEGNQWPTPPGKEDQA